MNTQQQLNAGATRRAQTAIFPWDCPRRAPLLHQERDASLIYDAQSWQRLLKLLQPSCLSLTGGPGFGGLQGSLWPEPCAVQPGAQRLPDKSSAAISFALGALTAVHQALPAQPSTRTTQPQFCRHLKTRWHHQEKLWRWHRMGQRKRAEVIQGENCK